MLVFRRWLYKQLATSLFYGNQSYLILYKTDRQVKKSPLGCFVGVNFHIHLILKWLFPLETIAWGYTASMFALNRYRKQACCEAFSLGEVQISYKIPTFLHSLIRQQTSHLGYCPRQTNLPCWTQQTWKEKRSFGSTSCSIWSWNLFESVFFTQPKRYEMRATCVSTGKTQYPKEYIIMQRADFRPIPGSVSRKASASFLSSRLSPRRDTSPNRLWIRSRAVLIFAAFCLESPPRTMAFPISFLDAWYAIFHDGKRFLKTPYAALSPFSCVRRDRVMYRYSSRGFFLFPRRDFG